MTIKLWNAPLTLGALSLALLPLPAAMAQCGKAPRALKPSGWQMQHQASVPNLVLASWGDRDPQEEPIVGMWHEVFTARSSNGSPSRKQSSTTPSPSGTATTPKS